MKHLLLATAILAYSSLGFSWGGRGHATLCEAAVFLVKNPDLKEFLTTRPHIMGHLCNIPDIYWKSLGPDVRKTGDPTHYFNAEKLGLKLEEVPTDYKKIVADYTGKANKTNESQTIFSVPDDVGSFWWRADQFYRLSLDNAKKMKAAAVPANFKEEQDVKSPFNESGYNMMAYMGIMGHFIGDMGQPFHNTSDHDGFAANHGGIHSYYEEAVVAQLSGDLMSNIIKEAKAMKAPKFIQQKSVIENCRQLSIVSNSEIKDVLKADVLLKPSSLKIDQGMSNKKTAERKDPSVTAKNFEKMITKQMARSSLLLAHLWDQMYEEAGKPEVKSYRSYLYPFTPDFVAPDYYDAPAKKN